jgi:cytochrome bd-type quinol oxidase subunit 2
MGIELSVIWFVIIVFATLMYIVMDGFDPGWRTGCRGLHLLRPLADQAQHVAVADPEDGAVNLRRY